MRRAACRSGWLQLRAVGSRGLISSLDARTGVSRVRTNNERELRARPAAILLSTYPIPTTYYPLPTTHYLTYWTYRTYLGKGRLGSDIVHRNAPPRYVPSSCMYLGFSTISSRHLGAAWLLPRGSRRRVRFGRNMGLWETWKTLLCYISLIYPAILCTC
jgi:hypothetical protein